MQTGTAYFPTFAHACTYYRPYYPGQSFHQIATATKAKLDSGEIHLGTPPHNPATQRVTLIDSCLRYALEDRPTPANSNARVLTPHH